MCSVSVEIPISKTLRGGEGGKNGKQALQQHQHTTMREGRAVVGRIDRRLAYFVQDEDVTSACLHDKPGKERLMISAKLLWMESAAGPYLAMPYSLAHQVPA